MTKILRVLLVSSMIFASIRVLADEPGERGAEYMGKSSFTEADYDKPSDDTDFGGSEPSFTAH